MPALRLPALFFEIGAQVTAGHQVAETDESVSQADDALAEVNGGVLQTTVGVVLLGVESAQGRAVGATVAFALVRRRVVLRFDGV